MTELPALRDALRETAERHVRRRHRHWHLPRPVRRFAVTVAAIALFGAVLSFNASDSTRPPADEVSVTATPSVPPILTVQDARPLLAEVYSVFKRPARPSDRVPAGFRRLERVGLQRADQQIAWSEARRVASSGENAVYAIPAIAEGEVELCTVIRVSARVGGGGCGVFVEAEATAKPRWSKTFVRQGGPVYSLVLPDGVTRVTITFRNGRTVTRPVQQNGLVYQGHGVRRFSWSDANGVEHALRASV